MTLIRQWLRCRRNRAELLALDGSQLRDVGISGDMLSEALQKPFWRT